LVLDFREVSKFLKPLFAPWFILQINGQTKTEVNTVQTKSQDLLTFLFGEHFCRLAIFKKLYVAIGLLLVASVLFFSVASVIQEKNKQRAVILPPAETAATLNEPALEQPKEEIAAINETPQKPVSGTVIQAFGWQEHPVYKDWRYHPGVDIGVPSEQNVQAVLSGKVTDIYIDRHYGLTAVIESKGYKIFYSALSIADTAKGSFVKAGQSIGRTGVCRDEPREHLHMAVKQDDRYIDPSSLF
jgi:murein DD-endopeptidase MepM/ murein hydrolase activator NlpD